MIEVTKRLFVGSDNDWKTLRDVSSLDNWTVVHAARDPYHREFLGYKTRGAPKDSPEYLYAQRGKRLALNIFDTDDVNYVNPQLMSVANSYIRTALRISNDNVLVHCNEGKSRGPTIAMCAIADKLSPDYPTARKMFEELYTEYKPMRGLEDFAKLYWHAYYENTI